jgi:hypothetical protein
MSRLALDIMLLQRLGVIGIILILIYSLYRKNVEITPNKDMVSLTTAYNVLSDPGTTVVVKTTNTPFF